MSRIRQRELQRTITERKQEARHIRKNQSHLKASAHRNIMGVRRCMIARAISYALDWRLKAQQGTLLELKPEVITSPKEKDQARVHNGCFVIMESSWRFYPPEWLLNQACVYLRTQSIKPNRYTFRMIRKALRSACNQGA